MTLIAKITSANELINYTKTVEVFQDPKYPSKNNFNQAGLTLHNICLSTLSLFKKMKDSKTVLSEADRIKIAKAVQELHQKIEPIQLEDSNEITKVILRILAPSIQSDFKAICSARDSIKWAFPESTPSKEWKEVTNCIMLCCNDLLTQLDALKVLCNDEIPAELKHIPNRLKMILKEFESVRLPTFLEKTYKLCSLPFFKQLSSWRVVGSVLGSITASIFLEKLYLAVGVLGVTAGISASLIHYFFDVRTSFQTKQKVEEYFAENTADSTPKSLLKSCMRRLTSYLGDKLPFIPASSTYHQFIKELNFTKEASSFLKLKTYGGFAKLCETSEGQKLLNHYLSLAKPKKLTIDHAVKDGSSIMCDNPKNTKHGTMLISEKLTIAIVKDEKGEETWGEIPLFCTLAHELLHYIHFLEDKNAMKTRKGVVHDRFTQLEEMFTITGEDGKGKKHDFAENRILTAYSLKNRTSHKSSGFPFNPSINAKLKNKKMTPLHDAAQSGVVGTIKDLLRKGAKIDATDTRNFTSLDFSLLKKKYPAAILLIEKGADLKKNGAWYFSSILHESIKTGQKELVSAILSSRYGKELLNKTSNNGDSPLHTALREGKEDIALLLIKNGASTTCKNTRDLNVTPLHLAAQNGFIEVCTRLSGAQINAPDIIGSTPLDYAFIYNQYEVATFLINNGAALREDTLHEAVESGNSGLVAAVFASPHSKDLINQLDQDGNSPLHLAVRCGSIEYCKLLLEKRGKINVQNEAGLTPLHLAVQLGHYEIAEFLVQHKALVNLQDNQGATPAHHAAMHGRSELLTLLANAQADLNLTTTKGLTPLHVAAIKGHHNSVEFLTGTPKVNINAQDKLGKTPLDFAIAHQKTAVEAILRTHGAKKPNEIRQANTIKAAPALVPRRTNAGTARRIGTCRAAPCAG